MTEIQSAKSALDNIIRKSRIHLYKPIQIAEILYHHRTEPGSIDLHILNDYRNISKKWRNDISLLLLGRICTSSARFQDDLFNDNAIPPEVLTVLGRENNKTGGAVEKYIYSHFADKHSQLASSLNYCLNTSKEDFDVLRFINSFRSEPGLKRSIDKVYEVVVYALFDTIVSALDVKIEVLVNPAKKQVLREFSDFANMVMSLDDAIYPCPQDGRLFRVGVTNAADRGLDMYSNWGPAIQVKHLSLSEELAEDIVTGISSNRIIIVCKDAEEKLIRSLLHQIGWQSRIQSIVTETNLIDWYDRALRGKYSDFLGDTLMSRLCSELQNEFPSVGDYPDVLKKRHYENIYNDFWK